jgi:hypothetical protein
MGTAALTALEITDPTHAEAGAFGEVLLREACRNPQLSQLRAERRRFGWAIGRR